MELIWTILVGFVVGVIAKFFVPGRGPSGFIMTTVLGIAGAWVGRWLLVDVFDLASSSGFIGAVIGAILLLFAYTALTRGGR